MSDKELTDKIIRYHEGEMTDAERQAFEQDLNRDEKLQQLQADYEQAQSAVDTLAYDELRSKLRQMAQPSEVIEKPAASRKIFSLSRLVVAATLLLLVVAGAYLWWPMANTPANLAAAYYQAPNFSSIRAEQASDDQWNTLTIAWQQENYAYIAQTLSNADSLKATEIQLLAHTYYQQQKWESAIAYFTELIGEEDERYTPQAHWFRALSYLQQGEITKAKADLQQLLSGDQAALREQAERLLEKL